MGRQPNAPDARAPEPSGQFTAERIDQAARFHEEGLNRRVFFNRSANMTKTFNEEEA
jgi:hypothetical protein